MAEDKNKPGDKIEPESLEETSDSTKTLAGSVLPTEDDLSKESEVDKVDAPEETISSLGKLLNFGNLYLLAFGLLLLFAIASVFTAIRLGEKDDAKTPAPQSLTDKQLAELKGSTTIIGDSQQILDIQSSSVFQAQVLMRGNLDVAGTLKVGGPLSLAAVTVGGTSSFGQVQINSTLSVAGNTILQGPTTVQDSLAVTGNGSFNGTLSANQLNVTNLQLTGDLTIIKHIIASGSIPGKTNGSALGGGGTATVSGTDTSGTVTINTGSAPPAGCFVTINFTSKFNTQPQVVISPSSANGANLNYYVNRSTANFSICTTSAPSGATTYTFDYIAID